MASKLKNQWNEMMEKYKEAYPELAKEFENALAGNLAEGWNIDLPSYDENTKLLQREPSLMKLSMQFHQNHKLHRWKCRSSWFK